MAFQLAYWYTPAASTSTTRQNPDYCAVEFELLWDPEAAKVGALVYLEVYASTPHGVFRLPDPIPVGKEDAKPSGGLRVAACVFIHFSPIPNEPPQLTLHPLTSHFSPRLPRLTAPTSSALRGHHLGIFHLSSFPLPPPDMDLHRLTQRGRMALANATVVDAFELTEDNPGGPACSFFLRSHRDGRAITFRTDDGGGSPGLTEMLMEKAGFQTRNARLVLYLTTAPAPAAEKTKAAECALGMGAFPPNKRVGITFDRVIVEQSEEISPEDRSHRESPTINVRAETTTSTSGVSGYLLEVDTTTYTSLPLERGSFAFESNSVSVLPAPREGEIHPLLAAQTQPRRRPPAYVSEAVSGPVSRACEDAILGAPPSAYPTAAVLDPHFAFPPPAPGLKHERSSSGGSEEERKVVKLKRSRIALRPGSRKGSMKSAVPPTPTIAERPSLPLPPLRAGMTVQT